MSENNTVAEIKAKVFAMSNDERKAILDKWAAGEGTERQRQMGVLAQHYPYRS